MVGSIVGAVAGGLVNKALGGGKTSQATASQPQTIAGSEFQPVTYTTNIGDVTGSQVGDYGYDWSANVAPWIENLGSLGAGSAQRMFQDYLSEAQLDPFTYADEIYQRQLDVLQPEFQKQNIALQERMFGTGRLGQKVGGVNPLAYEQSKAQQETLAKLYAGALGQGQTLQTQRLNQLSDAAAKMQALGLTPFEIQNQMINQAANLETQRSNALKTGTQQFYQPQSTTQGILAGKIGGTVGSAVTNWFDSPSASNFGFSPAENQSWGSWADNVSGGGLWSGGSSYQNSDGSSYYDPMNDFYA